MLRKFLRYPLCRRRLILGRSVESRTPLEEIFKKFAFLLCNYAHILNLNYKNILILKKIEFGHFRVQNPLKLTTANEARENLTITAMELKLLLYSIITPQPTP